MRLGVDPFSVVVLAGIALGESSCGGSASASGGAANATTTNVQPAGSATSSGGDAKVKSLGFSGLIGVDEAPPAPAPPPQEKHGVEGGTDGAVPSAGDKKTMKPASL